MLGIKKLTTKIDPPQKKYPHGRKEAQYSIEPHLIPDMARQGYKTVWERPQAGGPGLHALDFYPCRKFFLKGFSVQIPLLLGDRWVKRLDQVIELARLRPSTDPIDRK